MIRFRQIILILSTVVGSWLGMQAVHESGHVLGAWLTGGHVARVVLYPFSFSRTDLIRNPNPLVVVWMGPIVGIILPLLVWRISAISKATIAFVFRFFAGFCLLANGLYIGVGAFDSTGDCGEMQRNGSPMGLLIAFGVLTAPMGLLLWHRQGPHFGLGEAKGIVEPAATYTTLIGCLVLLALGFLLGGQ